MADGNQEVRLKVTFDEPAMRREAERASTRINAGGTAGGGGIGGGGGGSAGGSPAPMPSSVGGGGQWVSGAGRWATQAVQSPGETARRMAEEITIHAAGSVGGPWGENAARAIVDVGRAITETGRSNLETYAGVNADIARKRAIFRRDEMMHNIKMAKSGFAQGKVDTYLATKRAEHWIEEAVAGVLPGVKMTEAEGADAVRKLHGIDEVPGLVKGGKAIPPGDKGGATPAPNANPGPMNPNHNTHGLGPDKDADQGDQSRAEQRLQEHLARASAGQHSASPAAHDETRLLALAMGNDIGVIL